MKGYSKAAVRRRIVKRKSRVEESRISIPVHFLSTPVQRHFGLLSSKKTSFRHILGLFVTISVFSSHFCRQFAANRMFLTSKEQKHNEYRIYGKIKKNNNYNRKEYESNYDFGCRNDDDHTGS